jgi:hypothetical protein
LIEQVLHLSSFFANLPEFSKFSDAKYSLVTGLSSLPLLVVQN